MGDLYTQCEIYIISVVLPIAVWEVYHHCRRARHSRYSSTYLCNCNQELLFTSIALIYIAIRYIAIALLVMKTSTYCHIATQVRLHSCACIHGLAITDIIKLLDYSGLHAVRVEKLQLKLLLYTAASLIATDRLQLQVKR